jgi:hypothetical protein
MPALRLWHPSTSLLHWMYQGCTADVLRLSYAAALPQLRCSYAVDTEDQPGWRKMREVKGTWIRDEASMKPRWLRVFGSPKSAGARPLGGHRTVACSSYASPQRDLAGCGVAHREDPLRNTRKYNTQLLFYSDPLSKFEIAVTNLRQRESLCKCKVLSFLFFTEVHYLHLTSF